MIYIYQANGHWAVNRGKAPEGVEYIELKRMIPTPVRPGYDAKLNADLKTGAVWFDLVENIEGVRARKIVAIEAYDKSEAVNCFFMNGMPLWLDRETRAGLACAIDTDKALGSETTVIWYEAAQPPLKFELPIAVADAMLLQLEAYAKATYNITQSHIAAVYGLDTAERIEAYDHTAGYPAKLEF